MDGSYRNVAEDGTVTCDAFDACEATAVEDAFLSGLTVAPNPTTGRIDVHILEGHALVKVQIFDAMGRMLEVQEGAACAWTLVAGFAGVGRGHALPHVDLRGRLEHHPQGARQRSQVSWLRFTRVLKAPNITVTWSPCTATTSPRS